MKTLKKLIRSLALISALTFSSTTYAASGSAEINAGNKSATLDFKFSQELAPNIGLFVRNRITSNYQKKIDFFNLVDLSYKLLPGLDAILENQFTPERITPRIGMQYFHKAGNLKLFSASTFNLINEPNLELMSKISYEPQIGKYHLLNELEAITNLGRFGHNYSLQRLRLGLDLNGSKVGIAADFNEAGNNLIPSYNLGIFLRRDF